MYRTTKKLAYQRHRHDRRFSLCISMFKGFMLFRFW